MAQARVATEQGIYHRLNFFPLRSQSRHLAWRCRGSESGATVGIGTTFETDQSIGD